jgi:hypothetical protein
MNSHRSNDLIDTIIRDALQPITDARPPEGVWRRIVEELDQTRSHRRRFPWFKVFEGFSISPLTQRCCVGPYGRCLPVPLTQFVAIQFRGQHIAS